MGSNSRPGGFQSGGGDLARALGWRAFDDPKVAATYSLARLIGRGSYGHVVEGTHTPTGRRVAIKRIQYVFDDERDARCILREIRILRRLRHENVVQLLDVLAPAEREWATFNDVYLVFEVARPLVDTPPPSLIAVSVSAALPSSRASDRGAACRAAIAPSSGGAR